MAKARIIKRTNPGGDVKYVIQQKHFLFRWQWVDAWCNSLSGPSCQDTWSTLEEAEDNMCWFDGTGWKDEVVL